MALPLQAKVNSIKDIFSDGMVYKVPSYQRAYIWGQDDCYKMYNDIARAYNEDEDYFLGNIIVAKSDEMESELQIIDGQQRLTTIWLWLKAFSVLFPNESIYQKLLCVETWDKGQVAKISSEVTEKNDNETIRDLSRMANLNVEEKYAKYKSNDRKYVREYGDNRIIINFLEIYGWLKEFFDRVTDEKCNDFVSFFMNRVNLLHIELSDKTKIQATSKAIVIFETMNNRGRSLTDTDIFKATLYKKAESVGEKDKFSEKWKYLENTTENHSIKIIDLFRYYYHIARGEKRIITLESNLRDFYIDEQSPMMLLGYEEFLSKLQKVAQVIEKIELEKNSRSENARWLQVLDLYINKYSQYALVAYVYKNGLDNEGVVSFLKSLIRLCYYYRSSSYELKFEIYALIAYVMTGFDFKKKKNREVSEEFFDNVGRLRNGLVLLAYYLDSTNKTLADVAFKKIFYDSEKQHFPNVSQEDWNKTLRSLGNMYIYTYESSQEVAPIESLPTDINSRYQHVYDREREISSVLMKFFNKKDKI